MHEAAQVSELLVLLSEPEPACDVARVDRDRSRMTRRVPISRVEGRHEGGREREVRSLELEIGFSQVLCQPALLLVKAEQLLCCESWPEEERKRPRGDTLVCEYKKAGNRDVQWEGS